MAGEWYIARGKLKIGPYSFVELKELARTGGLLPKDMVFQDGTQKWRSAGEVEGLFWVTAPLPPENPAAAPAWEPVLAPALEPPLALEPMPAPEPLLVLEPASPPAVEPTPAPAPAPEPPLALEPTSAPKALPFALALEEIETATSRPTNPVPLAPGPTPAKPMVVIEKREKRGETIKTSRKVFRWISAAALLSVLLGVIGDFLQPVASFNLIAFATTAALAFSCFGLWVKRVGHPTGLVCAIFVTVATGFGGWWGLAHYKGSLENGYLAQHWRLVHRLQTAIVTKGEGERLVGVWVLGSDDPRVPPDSELRLKDGRMSWLISVPKSDSQIRIDAEYSTTKDSVVYGLITRIDYGTTMAKVKEQLPEEDDTFSFRFRVDDELLTIKDPRGKGFEELKKAAQGRYKRRGDPPPAK